jgi:phosphate:Na+ symporter
VCFYLVLNIKFVGFQYLKAMTGFLLFLTIAGASALFLYGLKLMSESLQKIMGEWLQLILTSMSSNRAKGVLTGIFITALIQSSSATTVMVVSFVNAGILRLTEAVGVIMGANIGTTLTAWLVVILGFEVDISAFILPLIGIGIPLIFSNNRNVKNWGEMLLGFSLIFIALEFLKRFIPNVVDSGLLNAITFIKSMGYVSYIILFFVGVLFTAFTRSSNAIFAVVLVLCYKGWITFDLGASMILGMNVGKTIVTINASRVANVTAKRAALAHLFYNLFGVTWALILLPYLIAGLVFITKNIGVGDPHQSIQAIPISLALFHTLFNIINTSVLVQFAKQITQFVIRKIPIDNLGENEFKLTHIKTGMLSTPDASLYQAKRETIVFAENVRKMYKSVERLIFEKNDKEYLMLKENIESKEILSDRLEKEIANFLTKVSEGRLSETSSRRLRALYEMIDDMESIADSCTNILNVVERKRAKKIEFPEPVNNNIMLMLNMVQESLDIMVTMLTHDDELPLSMSQETEKEINNFRDILKSEHLDNLEKGIYNYDAGIIYNDIISQCERIGDYAFNVVESYKTLF